jgi:uncharacterized protein (DUF2267 family)
MSMTGLETFDRTIQETNNWLKDLMCELNWEDRHRAYLALRATLHTLRDRLMPTEAAHLGAQLPMLIRGIFYEGWNPANKPVKERQKEEFLSHIRDQFQNDPEVDPQTVALAVFKLLTHKVSRGEIEDIKQTFPQELKELWPQSPN